MVKGVWQWEELKHAVLGVIVLCNKLQGDLHCKDRARVINQASKKCSKSDTLGWKQCRFKQTAPLTSMSTGFVLNQAPD